MQISRAFENTVVPLYISRIERINYFRWNDSFGKLTSLQTSFDACPHPRLLITMTGRRAGTPLTSSTIVNEGLHGVACTRKGKIRKLTGVIGEFLPEGTGEALGTRQTRKSGEQTAQFGGDVRSDLGPRAVHRLLSFLRPRALHLFSRISNRAWNKFPSSWIIIREGSLILTTLSE